MELRSAEHLLRVLQAHRQAVPGWRRWLVRCSALAVVVLATAATLTSHSFQSTLGGANVAQIPLGDYAGGDNPGGVAHFGAVTGTHPTLATDYLDGSSGWGAMTSAGNVLAWRGSGYRLVLGVPIIPNGTGGSLAAGASGAYDSNFVTLAQNLVNAGLSHAILRLGWEFNGTWYNWSVRNSTDAADFAAYWRNIVSAMRSVPGQSFAFIWNPNGDGPTNYTPDQAYPGDSYVDYVGTDIYDNCWCSPQTSQNAWNDQLTHPWGLNWLAGFGAAHAKPLGFPEWSVDFRTDGHGLGDDPYFINQFAAWISSNNIAFTNIFSFDAPDQQNDIIDGSFPNALAAFKTAFAGTGSPPTTTPTTAPTPSSTSTTAPSSPTVLADSFTRTTTGGWGTADTGGPWTQAKGNPVDVSTDGSTGKFVIPSAYYTSAEQLMTTQVAAQDSSGTFNVSWATNVKSLNPQYGGLLAGVLLRFQSASDTDKSYYRASLSWDANSGSPQLELRAQTAGSSPVGGSFRVNVNTGIDPTADYPGGGPYRYSVRYEITGTYPTTIKLKAWKTGTPEPAGWMLTGTDSANAGPQTTGALGVRASCDLGTGSTGPDPSLVGEIHVSDLSIQAGSGQPPPTTTTTTPQTTTTTSPTTTTSTPTSTTSTTEPPSPPPPPPPPPPGGRHATTAGVSVAPDAASDAQLVTAVVKPPPDGGKVQIFLDGWNVGHSFDLEAGPTAHVALAIAEGPHDVQVVYSGDQTYAPSSIDTMVTVGQAPSVLSVSAPSRVTGESDQVYSLHATLTGNNQPIVGASVWFSTHQASLCQGRTDASGTATCSFDEGATDQFGLASAGVDADFLGDSAFQASSAHAAGTGSAGPRPGGGGESPDASSREPDGGHHSGSGSGTSNAGSADTSTGTPTGSDRSSSATSAPGTSPRDGAEAVPHEFHDAMAAGRSTPVAGNVLVLVLTMGGLGALGIILVRRRVRFMARATKEERASARRHRPGAM